MRLERTRLVLEKSQAVVSQGQLGQDIFASYITEYILIVFYSEIEEMIQKFIFEKLESQGESEIANFICSMARAQIKRIKKSELSDTLGYFSKHKKDYFNKELDEQKIAKYQNFILNRHNTAHANGSVTVSWSDVQEIAEVGEEIVRKFKEALYINNDTVPLIETLNPHAEEHTTINDTQNAALGNAQ